MRIEDVLTEFGISAEKKLEHFLVTCPFHDDKNPSGQIHHKTGYFNCWVCNTRKTFTSFLMRHSNLPYYQIRKKLGTKSDCKDPINQLEVEGYHQLIWSHGTFLKELAHRCITEEIIRERRLGIINYGTEKRISIPIPNEIGEWANIRSYLPGAPDRKFLNSRGRGRNKTRFYPYDQLEFDTILVCGGELKALAAIPFLNKYDIGCIAPTCGENDWPNELNYLLTGKLLYINCDVDETGKKYAEHRCKIVKGVAREIHKVEFTLEEVGNLEKGDMNDFLRLGGDIYQKLLSTPEWIYIPGGELLEEAPASIEFRQAFQAENVGKRVSFPAVLAGVNNESWTIASTVNVKCSRDQEFCMVCDVNSKVLTEGGTEMSIGPEHPSILALSGEDDDDHSRIYKRAFNIPRNCRVCQFQPVKHYTITEARLDEPVDPTSRQDPLTMKVGYLVNGPDDLDSQTYNVTGRLHPSPKNQISSFIISKCEPTQDALDSYSSPSPEYFKLFEPKEWHLDALEEKVNDIYTDLEANVTKIYRRRDLHIAVDLCYHSVLHFDLGDLKHLNAYTELLIVGDTEEGKSETVEGLKEHYGLGHIVDGQGATKVGLTIGLEGGRGRHFAIYGAFPKNDRRLIIIEELGKMKQDVFQSLTEMRSSGRVVITKIGHKTRNARVRLIAIANPPHMRKIASYTFGIESALSVIGTYEDLRRFDLVQIVGYEDIKERPIPEIANPPKVTHTFDDESCQRLVLKAWKCENIVFEGHSYLLASSRRLLEVFGEGLPVLGQNSTHIKVAKLAAAIAARTHSYEMRDRETLVVRNCHVDFVEKYLKRIYSSPSCKLDEKAKSVRDQNQLRDRDSLVEYLRNISNATDVMRMISQEDNITQSFIRDVLGEFHGAALLFSKLIQSNAIQRVRNDRYAKTAEFTNLLKVIEVNGRKPEYLEKIAEQNKEQYKPKF